MEGSSFRDEILTKVKTVYLVLSPLGLVTSLACYIYVKKLIKVSIHIKDIISKESLVTFCCFSINLLGVALVSSVPDYVLIMGCGLIFDIGPLTFALIKFLDLQLAIVRYYMARQTGNNESIKYHLITRFRSKSRSH